MTHDHDKCDKRDAARVMLEQHLRAIFGVDSLHVIDTNASTIEAVTHCLRITEDTLVRNAKTLDEAIDSIASYLDSGSTLKSASMTAYFATMSVRVLLDEINILLGADYTQCEKRRTQECIDKILACARAGFLSGLVEHQARTRQRLEEKLTALEAESN